MKCDCFDTLFFTTISILFLLFGCQDQIKKSETKYIRLVGKPEPQITFEKLEHDFGEVAARKKYTCEFKFANTGEAPLKILQIKRCCGTVTKLAKKEFKPGENGVLEVEYLSGPNASTIKRIIYVSSNDKKNPKIELTIKAKVVPKVVCEPKRLRLVLRDKNAGCPNITLTSADGLQFSVKDFRSTGESIAVDVNPSLEATKFVLKPKVDLEKLKSRPTGFISIDLTHPDCKKITLSFSTLLRFDFIPRSIIVFNPEPEKPTVKKITIINNYGEDFEIESTSSQKGFVKVLNRQKTDKGYQLEVEITPPQRDGTGRATDVLYVQLKEDEKLEIKCYIRYLSKEEN